MPVDATLLLTNRISPASVEPLRAKEYWRLTATIAVDELPGMTAASIAERTGDAELSDRVATLLDAGTGLAVALEELEARGIRLLPYGDEAYPALLRDRLRDAAPPMLYVAGPVAWLTTALIGVVGSRSVDEAGAQVARGVAQVAARHGAGIVSGGAKGVDLLSMDAANQAGVPSVGVTAEGLERAGRRRELRGAVAEGRLLLVSPYAPGAGFSVGSAMGRNKLIYGLAVDTLVVAADHDTGGTWAGAKEALGRGFGAVAVWSSAGGGPGNRPLIELGATAVGSLDDWAPGSGVAPARSDAAEQLGLGL